jgi:hypothetical protein
MAHTPPSRHSINEPLLGEQPRPARTSVCQQVTNALGGWNNAGFKCMDSFIAWGDHLSKKWAPLELFIRGFSVLGAATPTGLGMTNNLDSLTHDMAFAGVGGGITMLGNVAYRTGVIEVPKHVYERGSAHTPNMTKLQQIGWLLNFLPSGLSAALAGIMVKKFGEAHEYATWVTIGSLVLLAILNFIGSEYSGKSAMRQKTKIDALAEKELTNCGVRLFNTVHTCLSRVLIPITYGVGAKRLAEYAVEPYLGHEAAVAATLLFAMPANQMTAQIFINSRNTLMMDMKDTVKEKNLTRRAKIIRFVFIILAWLTGSYAFYNVGIGNIPEVSNYLLDLKPHNSSLGEDSFYLDEHNFISMILAITACVLTSFAWGRGGVIADEMKNRCCIKLNKCRSGGDAEVNMMDPLGPFLIIEHRDANARASLSSRASIEEVFDLEAPPPRDGLHMDSIPEAASRQASDEEEGGAAAYSPPLPPTSSSSINHGSAWQIIERKTNAG